MRKPVHIIFFFLLLACNKDDDPEKYSSINGYWEVKTPDNATTVTFRVAQDSDQQYVIETATVNHNGVDYNSKPIDASIVTTSPTEVESITMLNNDNNVPFFIIRFLDISVNADFTEMQITNSIFHIDNNAREFPMLKATR